RWRDRAGARERGAPAACVWSSGSPRSAACGMDRSSPVRSGAAARTASAPNWTGGHPRRDVSWPTHLSGGIESLQRPRELLARGVDTRPDRVEGHLLELGDLPPRVPLDLEQHEGGALIRVQPVQELLQEGA